MKKIFTLVLLFISLNTFSQLLVENFDYPVGTVLSTSTSPVTDWFVNSGVGTNSPSVVSPGLTFAGYASSGIGNAVGLTTTGEDIYKVLSSSVTSGTVYASVLINVSAAQSAGDYFFHLSNNSTTFQPRLFAKSSGSGYTIGLSKGEASTSASYTTTVYNFNQTYLVILKYQFNSASTTDDEVSLFVIESTIPASEPVTPTIGPITSNTTDLALISRVCLRQGAAANAPTVVVDGIRVATDWTNAATMPLNLLGFRGAVINGDANLVWNTANEVNVAGFIVEKSTNGSNFENVGFVAAKNTASATYNFTTSLTVGNNFYRLKMMDKDGTYSYSKVITLNNRTGVKLELFPNPVVNTLTLTHEKATETARVKVTAIDGKILLTQVLQAGATQSTVDVSKLTKGTYVLVYDNDGKNSAVIFVKQ